MFTVPVDKFYIISVCSNPVRYHTRYRLFKRFQKHMHDVGAQLITCEIAFGNRPFVLTHPDYKYDFQLRTNEELWFKENAINLTIARLCQIDPEWKYVGWVDGDVYFQRQDIIMETVHQLQHYDIVQMFSHVLDLGPNYEPVQTMNGFVWSYHQNGFNPPIGPGYMPKKKKFIPGVIPKQDGDDNTPEFPYPYDVRPHPHPHPPHPPHPYKGTWKDQGGEWVRGSFWHCGYAWAARRSALDKISLFDKAILGSSDHHMAMGLIGQIERSIPTTISPSYRNCCLNWQAIAEQRIRRNIGYVPGLLSHYWHGKKKDRKYVDRWKILVQNEYDPSIDISRDTQGLYRLNCHHGERSMRLRDEVRAYFRARNEDTIETEEAS